MRLRISSLAFIYLSCLLASFSLMAKQLQATIDKNPVAQNEMVNLTISADEGLDSDDLNFDVLRKDFYVGQPSFGRSTTNINGKTSVQTQWRITIAPLHQGQVTIPSFSVNGAQSQPIDLLVTPNHNQPNLADLFQINTQIENTVLYPQQSTLLHMTLKIKTDLRRLDNPQIIPPQVEGMTIEPEGKMTQKQGIENGLSVTQFEQAFRLTAKNSGTFTLIGATLTGVYYSGSQQFGQMNEIPIHLKKQNITIKVKPLPDSFHGQWLPAKSLVMKQQWLDEHGQPLSQAMSTIKQGSALTRLITIKAQGANKESLPELKIDYPSSLRVYPEQPQFVQDKQGNLTMTVKQVIIASQVGDVTVPGFQLPWWNSDKDQSQLATIKGRQFHISADPNTLVSLTAPTASAPVTTPTALSTAPTTRPYWQWATFAFAALWLITFGLLILQRKKTAAAPMDTSAPIDETISKEILISLIKQGDAAKIQHGCDRFIGQCGQLLSPEVQQSIHSELANMHQAKFSQQNQKWQPDTLIKLIKQCSVKAKQSYRLTPL